MKTWQIILICFFCTSLQAQKGWEVGGWLGTSQYYGDLNDKINLSDLGVAGGALARFNFNNRISVRGGLSYARLSAEDANSDNNFNRNRNLSFKSSVMDASGALEFNFFPYTHGSNDEFYTPYIFAGMSLFRFNPMAELDGETYELQPLGTEGQPLGSEYSRVNGGWLLGGGFKWDINYDWSINIELSYRSLWTDYLDDVSTVFPDLDDLESQRGATAASLSNRALLDGIAEEGRQRGDSTRNDQYVFVGVGVMKYFGRLECPKISDVR